MVDAVDEIGVLVAEDDSDLRELFSTILSTAGYDVVAVRDGVEASEALLERDIDDPSTQLFETAMQTLYREHPVRYPVIGFQPCVQKLTKQDIIGYYHRMYVPDNISQVTWSMPATNRLLFEAGGMLYKFSWRDLPEPGVTTDLNSVLEQSINTRYRSAASYAGQAGGLASAP